MNNVEFFTRTVTYSFGETKERNLMYTAWKVTQIIGPGIEGDIMRRAFSCR